MLKSKPFFSFSVRTLSTRKQITQEENPCPQNTKKGCLITSWPRTISQQSGQGTLATLGQAARPHRMSWFPWTLQHCMSHLHLRSSRIVAKKANEIHHSGRPGSVKLHTPFPSAPLRAILPARPHKVIYLAYGFCWMLIFLPWG